MGICVFSNQPDYKFLESEDFVLNDFSDSAPCVNDFILYHCISCLFEHKL